MTDSPRNLEVLQSDKETVVLKGPDGGGGRVSIPAVEALFEAVIKYNLQFIQGARALSSDREDKIFDFVSSVHLANEVPGEKTSVVNFTDKNQEIIDQIGLSLEPKFGRKNKFLVIDMHANNREIALNVADGKKFVSFLNLLSPDQIARTDLKYYLNDLSRMLSNKILDQYGFSQPSSEELDLLGDLPAIIDNYRRLGLIDSIEKTEIYLTYIKQGTMREYAEIERKGLFRGPDADGGLAKWQTDTTPEKLWRDWGTALEVLKKCRLNPRAAQLYKELLSNLINCANVASHNIPASIPTEIRLKFDEILSGVKSRLAEM